jgi:catechol 2,3-dioxygenase-like lactoylglutathione lyase family enzyme
MATKSGSSSAPGDGFVLDHVAFGVPDAAPAVPFLVGELGARPYEGGPGMGFLWWQWSFAGGGRVEVISPHGPPGGFLHRFLERQGPGVHHVTFKVPKLSAALERVRAHGLDVVGHDERNPGWKEAFLHPKQAHGIVVQLAESYPSLDAGVDPNCRFPDAPPAPDIQATLAGVVLSMHDPGAARRQWGDVLAGTVEASHGALSFRWSDSPVAIVVEIDPRAPEGPKRLELACPRRLALPEGPHPILGIELRQLPARA